MDASAAGRALTRWTDARFVVILLSDGETVHNAFFDRTFKP
jgi:hypothetical protein